MSNVTLNTGTASQRWSQLRESMGLGDDATTECNLFGFLLYIV